LACESETASSREATVASIVVRGLSLIRFGNGESPILPALLPLLSFGENILSMPSLPAIINLSNSDSHQVKMEHANYKDIFHWSDKEHTSSKALWPKESIGQYFNKGLNYNAAQSKHIGQGVSMGWTVMHGKKRRGSPTTGGWECWGLPEQQAYPATSQCRSQLYIMYECITMIQHSKHFLFI